MELVEQTEYRTRWAGARLWRRPSWVSPIDLVSQAGVAVCLVLLHLAEPTVAPPSGQVEKPEARLVARLLDLQVKEKVLLRRYGTVNADIG